MKNFGIIFNQCKAILCFLLVVICCNNFSAQTAVFTEHFSGTALPTGWVRTAAWNPVAPGTGATGSTAAHVELPTSSANNSLFTKTFTATAGYSYYLTYFDIGTASPNALNIYVSNLNPPAQSAVNTNTGTNFINGTNTGILSSSWASKTSAVWVCPTSGTYFFAFNGSTTATAKLRLDLIVLYETAPSCSAPSTQASGLSFPTTNYNDISLSWINGNGDNVIVVAKKTSSTSSDPVNTNNYSSNSIFGSGSQIGTGNYVVYKGTGTSVTVTGLYPNTNYSFSIYAYNDNSGSPCYNSVEHVGNRTTLFNRNFYVNDDCATANVFCITGVVGNASNSGTSPDAPKRTLKDLWTTYGPAGTNILTAGDTIFIDAGRYARGGTDAVTNESKFDITVAGLVFQGAGMNKTTFDNDNYGTNTDYFMEINANNVSLRDMTVTQYESNAPNSGTTYNRGTGSFNTGGQAISIFGCTGILIENVNTFDNGNGGNAAIGIGPNTTSVIKGGGSNCNATGSAYSGGIDIFGNNTNTTILNYVLAYNSKDSYNGAALSVYGVTASTIVYVKNTVISSNNGGAGDGIIYIDGGNVTMRECKVIANRSTGLGGSYHLAAGISIVGGTVKIAKTLISDNTKTAGGIAEFGGVGVYPKSSSVILSIDSCLFSANSGTSPTGKDLAARIFSSTKTFAITVNETTFANYGVGTSAIDIGGGSANSCTGNSFRITNSGNPSIVYTGAGAPNCSLGAGSNTTVSLYTANPTVPTFSGPCGSFVLPVELKSFSVKCTNNSAKLVWSTASERNNDYFLLEKADEKGDFKFIGKIKGSGNSSDSKHYDFSDLYAFSGISYYRLSQVDFNGKSELLSTISFENTCLEKEKSTCYYNPALNEITVNGEFNQSADYSLKLINTLGQIISETAIKKSEKLTLKLDQELAKSVYFVLVEGNDTKESIKITLY